MYTPDMKSLIKMSIELDIYSLEIKEGYNGAPLLVVYTKNNKVAEQILKFAKNISKDVVVHQIDDKIKISCVFGDDTEDNNIYRLK